MAEKPTSETQPYFTCPIGEARCACILTRHADKLCPCATCAIARTHAQTFINALGEPAEKILADSGTRMRAKVLHFGAPTPGAQALTLGPMLSHDDFIEKLCKTLSAENQDTYERMLALLRHENEVADDEK